MSVHSPDGRLPANARDLVRRSPDRVGAGVHRLLLALRANAPGTLRFLQSLWRYSKLAPQGGIQLADLTPYLHDGTASTSVDSHYFLQAAWATARIRAASASSHIDVGSDLLFVSCLTGIVPVTFIDIRPPVLSSPNLRLVHGSILALPFASQSVRSLSCLHVAEHVGLGRYGDPLDPEGTRLACAELSRILAQGGDLLFSVPVGRSRTCFNAHRIHAPREILALFGDLCLLEFSVVDDAGLLHLNRSPESAEILEYGCGLFHFKRGS